MPEKSKSGQKEQNQPDTPHYVGHRARLRQRFLEGGGQALHDYELLELILFMAIPRRDVKPISKALLARFGDFAGVMNAPAAELRKIEGISDTVVSALKAVRAASEKLLQSEVINRPVLSSWSRLLDYCHVAMAGEKEEQFRCLYLDRKNVLIRDEVLSRGTIDHTPVYTREVLKKGLENGATALILVHNHPSGDPEPSKEDIAMTKEIIAAARPLNIVIHDHIIVGKYDSVSLRNLGLIT